MQARLKDRLENWKVKCFSKTREKKYMQNHIRRINHRVMELENELSACKKKLSPDRIPNHTYPSQMVALAVFIVVVGNGSLRCAAKTVEFFALLMGWDYGAPSHVTIRNWVLRCGLHEMDGGEDKSGDYVGMMDESIEIGGEKLLLLLGIKLREDRSHCAPLQMSDVEVLGMEVQQSWNGDDVSDFVERRQKHHRKINFRYFITDGGTTLLSALRKLGLSSVRDCTHIMMNLAKKLFSEDGELSELCAKVGGLRQRFCFSDIGHLLPPTLRDKDRFLRIFTLVDWYQRIMSHWDKLPLEVQQKLDFLMDYEVLMQRMEQVRNLISITSKTLKSTGISLEAIEIWEKRISEYTKGIKLTLTAKSFIVSVRQYLKDHISLMEQNGRLLCCTDIIESTFGHYKNKGGMKVISADVLKIALYGKEINTEFVKKALTNTSQVNIDEWHKNYTCDNRFSILHRMNQELKDAS